MRLGSNYRLVLPALLGVATYLPAFNNFFISDDFVYLSQTKLVLENPSQIFQVPPGFYRLTGHLYFLFCFTIFGLNAEGYYAMSLLLHIAASYLVYSLVRKSTQDDIAALIASLFFGVYEAHREAVFWISAVHELFLGVAILVCMNKWRLSLSPFRGSRKYYYYSLIAFAVALLSKESSLILIPLLVAFECLATPQPLGQRGPNFRMHLPLVLMGLLYGIAVYRSSPLIAHGFYGITSHWFVVYARTVNILLHQIYLGILLMLVFFLGPKLRDLAKQERAFQFFGIWILITSVPYCFVTYLDQLASRQMYLPSVGTAGLVGIIGSRLYSHLTQRHLKELGYLLLSLVVAGNIAYVWRTDAQFVKRAQPTIVLLETLKKPRPSNRGTVYVICDSPYNEVITRAAIEVFLGPKVGELKFVKSVAKGTLRYTDQDYVFEWDEKGEVLHVRKIPLV